MNGHPELRDHLDAYLAVREALGFNDAARRAVLRSFVEYAIVAERWPIDVQLAVDWEARTARNEASRCGQTRPRY